MRRFFPLVFLAAVHSSALAEPFSFEGFQLGMPRADATQVRPEAPWRPPAGDAPSEATRKEFTASYLGRTADVSIGLDQGGRFVRTIAFTFRTPSDSQCILEAVAARLQLEGRYGVAAEKGSEPFGRWVRWTTGDGATLRWLEACAVGTREYFVTYTKAAD
jgi:hypothetical protein